MCFSKMLQTVAEHERKSVCLYPVLRAGLSKGQVDMLENISRDKVRDCEELFLNLKATSWT